MDLKGSKKSFRIKMSDFKLKPTKLGSFEINSDIWKFPTKKEIKKGKGWWI